MRNIFIILFLAATFFSCRKAVPESTVPSILSIPAGFPQMSFPEDNEFTLDRWKLGRKLFYDPVLSIDGKVSCGSCHQQDLAFTDGKAKSTGAFNREVSRNAPSLANVGYHPYFMSEGGVPTLEMQVLVPIQEHNEFNHNIVDIAEVLKKDVQYVEMSKAAYDREPDAFVITRAISVFERTLISGNSSYDKYKYQQKDVLSASEKRGMELFFSTKTNCSSCHSGFNFTDYSFKNNGLDTMYDDIGRMRLTGDPDDEALFKVPGLRNVALTAPYMHNGSIKTLEEVIEHYDSGGKSHPNKSVLIQPLWLTAQEKADLLAFLTSLTDQDFISNPLFAPLP